MKHFPKRATSIQKLARKKFHTMKFTGDFKELIGEPECAGSWIIYGDSGNGKTTFALQLLKYITKFRKCAYIPLEEGTKLTFQEAILNANLLSVSSKVKIWEGYTVQDITIELQKPKAPKVVFIDSLQYLRMNQQLMNQLTIFQYKEMLESNPDTLFVFISHAKNKEPKGALAESVFFGSDVCLFVEDFTVTPRKSRYGGKSLFTLQ